ncbi:flagellar export protein FliJ [Robinsoniella peoriensis]
MKKFEFTLKKMQNYQEQVLQKEKNAMGQLQARRNELAACQEEIKIQLQDIHWEMNREIRKGTTIYRINTFTMMIKNGKTHLEDIKRQISVLETEIEVQRQIVVEASKEVSKLTKLEEKQREEYRQAVAKEEQENVLEYISGKFVKQGVS